MTSFARSEGGFIRSGLVLVLSAALWLGCSQDALDPHDDGSGGGPASSGGAGGAPGGGAAGTGGAPDGGCLATEAINEPGGPGSFLYESPGCGDATPQPICKAAIPACISHVCSCAGKVISGCHYYPAPYAYPFTGPLDAAAAGTDCDPNTPPAH